ncbi:MAG: protein kinase [Myxococcales bacterium]|nr:protein kinase [Myxococcales bacterium]
MPPAEINPTALIGSLVGDYTVEELRSDGTHYAIYRAVHRKLERQAEVRVHHPHLCDAAMLERIEKMARVISRIRHPNVVELYDYDRLDDGRAFIVREWVAGKLLFDRVKGLSPAEIHKALKELCAGFAAMHEAGLAHGELSRSSIMLAESSGELKIVGPFLDRSPEHFEQATVAGDIAALGGLIHELFGIRDGSAATDDGAALVPSVVDEIVRRCKSTDSADRFDSVVSVAQALEKALGDSGRHDDGLAPGTLIADTYRVYSVIGSGGMGKVYEAAHKRLPQRVAIKVISGDHHEESLARLRQEAEIASSVGHPHIVRVFDFNALPDGRPYMVMEFLEGEDLAKALGRGALPLERALAIAGQIGSALSAAHAKGIVHRDLKPPNIFLGSVDIGGARREHATVLDFGVSKREDAELSITQTEAIIGTPRYMAPEQAMGKHDSVGPLSDQFALACIVYEMLSGRRCFGGRDLAEIVHSVCCVDPIGLAEICPKLDPRIPPAVERAMSKRPEDRFSSMNEFVAALEGRTY